MYILQNSILDYSVNIDFAEYVARRPMSSLFNQIIILNSNVNECTLIKECMEELQFCNTLYLVHTLASCKSVLDQLKSEHHVPEMIFVNIDDEGVFPELIHSIRKDPYFKSLITISITENDERRHHAYRYNLAGSLVRPFDKTSLKKQLDVFKNYWRLNVRPL